MQYTDTSGIKHLFHWVKDQKTRDRVLSHGIVPDKMGFIYLSEKPLHSDKGFVFKVSIPDNSFLFDWREFWRDSSEGKEYDPLNPYYVYVDHTIPPDLVELVPEYPTVLSGSSSSTFPFSYLVSVYRRGQ